MLKNKNLIIALPVMIILILAAGAIYLGLSKFSTPPVRQINVEKSPSASPTPKSAMKSLIDLLSQKQDVQCTFKGAATNGTVYLSNGNMRGNFTANENGKEILANIIRNGNETYIWTGNSASGIKMSVSVQELSDNSQINQYVSPNGKINYTCSPWSVDNSMFTPPDNIKFTDVSGLMPKTSAQPSASSGAQTGSPCDQISDPTAKAACINSMQQSGY